MKLVEIAALNSAPEVGKAYKLADSPELGDFRNLKVYVETGPRNAGTKSEQYRVSYGQEMYDVDWIDTSMFKDAKILRKVPDKLIYKGPK